MFDKYRYVFQHPKTKNIKLEFAPWEAIENSPDNVVYMPVRGLIQTYKSISYILIARDPFIGLFDANGQEIYYRDIVETFGRGIEWCSPVLYCEAAFGYYHQRMHISFCGNINFEWENNQSEHIWKVGNIYQNPDMVEDWKRRNPKWQETYPELKGGLW